jgi:hypothetical protein
MQAKDPATELLVETLARALASPGEQRLYRSGKLDGLFPGRGALAVECAERALRDGLIERVRVEVKGKTEIDWVRIAPRGVEFLHEHESPLRALQNFRATLRANRDGIPIWLADQRAALDQLAARLTADAEAWRQRLACLEQRVADTLQRLEAASPLVPPEVLQSHPWTVDALNYLDRRRSAGAAGDCPLPELFSAVVGHHPQLGLPEFHEGLRQLEQRRAVRLRPAENDAEITRPEYALLAGSSVCYYAVR